MMALLLPPLLLAAVLSVPAMASSVSAKAGKPSKSSAALKASKSSKDAKASALAGKYDLTREPRIWRKNPALKRFAQKLEPLSRSQRPGAQGTNRSHPERVLLRYQSIGLDWIRLGLIEENGFMIDRGVSCFEWGFQAVGSDGTFGQSTYTETVDFLGRYAHAVLLLKANPAPYLKNRLDAMLKLAPYLDKALNSPVLLKSEKQWDRAERAVQNTHTRAQAAAAAYWLARLKLNPKLAETAGLWIDEVISRQLPNGAFRTQLKAGSKAETAAMVEVAQALLPIAFADPVIRLKLSSAMKLFLKSFSSGAKRSNKEKSSVAVAQELIRENLRL